MCKKCSKNVRQNFTKTQETAKCTLVYIKIDGTR